MRIKTINILFPILVSLLAINACSVNWDSPETQNVDQMLSDTGLGPADTGPIQSHALESLLTNATSHNESEWFNIGAERFREGRYDESLQAYDNVIAINPRNAEAWNNRGIDLGRLGRYDDAFQSFTKATTINPSSAEAWFNVGIAYDFFGEYSDAIDAYNRAIEINPNYSQAKNKKDEDIVYLNNHEMNPYP